jgi:DNA-binding beta-propeller fold protein YncE
MKMKALKVLLAAVAFLPLAQGGSVFMGAYPSSLVVFDDVKEVISARIPLTTGLPVSIRLSMDKKKIYVTTNDHSGIEVVDVATRKVLNHFVLNTPTKTYRFTRGTPDPTGKFFYTTAVEITKLADHFDVAPPKYMVIDLEGQKIAKMYDMAAEDAKAFNTYRGGMEISRDGKFLYDFRDKVVIISTDDFHVIDRIDLAKPDLPGLENVGFGGNLDSIGEPGQHISVFNAADPYIHNRVFGVARFNLDTQAVDFQEIGPAPAAMSGMMVSPDKKNAWTAVSTGALGNVRCEFWHFDLATNKVVNRAEFSCRSRYTFGMAADGKKLYVYGAGFEIEVYDAVTMKLERTLDLNNDITMAGMIQVE